MILTNKNRGLVEALEWAIAELEGSTRYDEPGQYSQCLIRARQALSTTQEEDAAERVAADAYQVIGAIAFHGGLSDEPEVVRALDYFSGDNLDGSILPFLLPARSTTPPEREAVERVKKLADYLVEVPTDYHTKRPPHPYPGPPHAANRQAADDLRLVLSLLESRT